MLALVYVLQLYVDELKAAMNIIEKLKAYVHQYFRSNEIILLTVFIYDDPYLGQRMQI